MCKQIGNLCSRCKTDNLDIIKEDKEVIHLFCNICDIYYKIKKSRRDSFIKAVETNYGFENVQEFANDHFQNLISIEENVAIFQRWLQ